MDKVLLTGGLGIIGAFVCRALLEANCQPVVYDMGSDTKLIADVSDRCLIERGNTTDLPRLMEVIARYRPSAIIHLAGKVGASVERYPWSALDTNLIGTTTVFEAARLSGVTRIAFPSSRQVYGPVQERHRHPNYEPVTEVHPREPQLLYGKMKRMCEDVADHYAQLYKLDIVALRFGSAFGPGRLGTYSNASPLLAMTEAAIAGRPFRIACGADQYDELCYAGDYANGLVTATLSAPLPGKLRTYNIGSGELISLREMIAVLKELYPGFDGQAEPGFDYRKLGIGHYFRLSSEKAKAEIGYKPKYDFRKSVIDYAETMARLAKLNA